MARAFVDSNVLVYLLSADAAKADRAEALLAGGPMVSVQVLNEVANVARRKLGMGWQELGEFLGLVRGLCTVEPLTVETHERGLQLAERFGFALYDAMIVAAALQAGCDRLYSEDMQDGQVIEGTLRLQDPFAGSA